MCQHHIAICIKLFIPEHYVIETPKLSKMSVDFNGNAPPKAAKNWAHLRITYYLYDNQKSITLKKKRKHNWGSKNTANKCNISCSNELCGLFKKSKKRSAFY